MKIPFVHRYDENERGPNKSGLHVLLNDKRPTARILVLRVPIVRTKSLNFARATAPCQLRLFVVLWDAVPDQSRRAGTDWHQVGPMTTILRSQRI